jgi:hypothetical protein
VNGVKLFALPLLFVISRQTRYRNFLQIPFLIVYRLQTPYSIHDRIPDCSAMWSSDTLAVIDLLVVVVVATSAARKCGLTSLEVSTLCSA